MAERVDLLVIGGGMAGSMAALTAADGGLSVVLVRKGYGATAISSGAIDFPEKGALAEGICQEAAAFFRAKMAAVGYPYKGVPGETATLFTALGTRKVTTLYPHSTAAGQESGLAGSHILFLAVSGLAEYNAAYVARAVKKVCGGNSLETAAIEVDFPGIRHTHNVLGFELAQLLDEGETRRQFGEVVAQVARQSPYTHVALPPIIGLERSREAMAELESACGLPCFELLSPPPSLLGLRLQNALDLALRGRMRIVHGVVAQIASSGGWIHRINVLDRDTEYILSPEAVVLASGKFIGGGLTHEGRLREAILGLPLWLGDVRITGESVRDLSQERFTAPQPFLAIGLRTDGNLRPLGKDGQAAYKNLWAAGAILQGHDYTAGCGNLGAALVNGYRIGKWLGEQR